MFPYCDRLAQLMDCYPTRKRAGSLIRWMRVMLAPATTMHYFDTHLAATTADHSPIHAPIGITALLLLVKPFDLLYRLFHRDP